MARPSTVGSLRERVVRAVAQLNQGQPDELLSRYAEDVIVRVPLYRPGDPVGEPELRGKAAFRDFLLRYLAHHRSYSVRDVFPQPDGMLISLECREGERMTVRVRMDEEGLGREVTVYVT